MRHVDWGLCWLVVYLRQCVGMVADAEHFVFLYAQSVSCISTASSVHTGWGPLNHFTSALLHLQHVWRAALTLVCWDAPFGRLLGDQTWSLCL
jgi:hypothetical protein